MVGGYDYFEQFANEHLVPCCDCLTSTWILFIITVVSVIIISSAVITDDH